MCKQRKHGAKPESTVTDHHAVSPFPLPPDVPPSRACSCVILGTFFFSPCAFNAVQVPDGTSVCLWWLVQLARAVPCPRSLLPLGGLVLFLRLFGRRSHRCSKDSRVSWPARSCNRAATSQCSSHVRSTRPKDSLMVWARAGLLEFRYYLPQTLLFLLHQPLGAWRGEARRVQINMKRDTGDDLSPWFKADVAALLLYILINAGIRSFSSLGLDD